MPFTAHTAKDRQGAVSGDEVKLLPVRIKGSGAAFQGHRYGQGCVFAFQVAGFPQVACGRVVGIGQTQALIQHDGISKTASQLCRKLRTPPRGLPSSMSQTNRRGKVCGGQMVGHGMQPLWMVFGSGMTKK